MSDFPIIGTLANQSATTSATSASIAWRASRFCDLSLVDLQNIYLARQQVFGVEQRCIYLDVDGCDEASLHVAAWSAVQRAPLAYARLVDPGIKYAEPSMGRVLTTAAARGTGLGRALVARVIELSDDFFPGRGLRISAQARLESFYAGFAFRAVGGPYLEDGIPHIEMFRA
jgi:ElaA protein